MTTASLPCPDCGRKVVEVELLDAATTVRRRHCRGCGEHWSIVVKPLTKGGGIRTDEVTWARVAQVSEEE